MFRFEFTSSMGNQESREIHPSEGLPLLERLERLGAVEISVLTPSGKRWDLAEARHHFQTNFG